MIELIELTNLNINLPSEDFMLRFIRFLFHFLYIYVFFFFSICTAQDIDYPVETGRSNEARNVVTTVVCST